MEATVSLALLVLVMVVALTLLFQMKAFAERQQFVTQPRQAARRAIDYLTSQVSGAADLNFLSPESGSPVNNPNALVCWYGTEASSSVLKQACFNNLTSAQAAAGLGDEGTDILTLSVAQAPLRAGVVVPPAGKHDLASGISVDFSAGCSVDAANNLRIFKDLTGAHATAGGERSNVMTLIDKDGNWQYFQITEYTSTDCVGGGATNFIVVKSDPSAAPVFTGTAPNGERPLLAPVSLAAGVQFISFRVRNGSLEQKIGHFDDATDNPGTDFVPIVENIVDLQVAYVYPSGAIWNDATNSLASAGFTGGIPPQMGPCAGLASPGCANPVVTPLDPGGRDAQNVIGIRISVVARSPQLTIAAQSLTQRSGPLPNHRRPALEDHTIGAAPSVGQPIYEYYRLTTTLMLRNRVLGS